MNTYLVLKWLHIVSSVLMVGTGLGSAFYMFFANRSGSVPAQAVVSRLVVRADWWFTTPTVILQPVTGFALAHMAGWRPLRRRRTARPRRCHRCICATSATGNCWAIRPSWRWPLCSG